MRRRLVGEIENLAKEPVRESTGIAEVHNVIVKKTTSSVKHDAIINPDEDVYSTSTMVITKSEWSSVKSFGNEKGPCVTELDNELQLLYQFTYGIVPTIGKESIAVKEAMTEGTKGQCLAKADNVPVPIQVQTNPNTSVHQEVSTVGEPGDILSPEQIEEIEKVLNAFNKILLTAGQEPLKGLLKETILINMVDTGGQPAFLEMLPALTMGPALYLIFFRLNQKLKQTYQIRYVSKDNEEVPLGDSSYTVEEVIFQALSSIACFSCTAPKKANMPNPSHAAMLMGTHKDLLGSNPKTVEAEIKARDIVLQDNLREILETDYLESGKDLLQYASDDQLMFAIDNMTGGKEEMRKVQERLEEVINQKFDDFPIPASWLMFSIFLRKMGKRTMSLSQCRHIGERLEVRDTDEALWFLHHCVGILMHFPEVEEIKDIVICDPQVVFDSVTDLILKSFTFEHVSKAACDKFKASGLFHFNDIQRIARLSKSDSLPLPKLVKLLEHVNIIAPIKTGSSQTSVEYFMPAALRHATEEELHVKHSSVDPVPLMIHFKCGFVPVGVFCAMIARLVAQKKWELVVPSGSSSLYKNKVTFRIYHAQDITLVSRPKWYEIHVACISESKKTFIDICNEVRETVCNTLDQVISKMKNKPYQISLSDQTLYELGFQCPEHLGEKDYDGHLVTPEEGESPSANSLWSSYLETKPMMICRSERKTTEDTLLSPDQHLVWFGKVSEL